RRRDLVFPALAAVGFALRDNVSRYGFREFADATLAAAVTATTSVVILWGYAVVAARERLRFPLVGVKFLLCAGVAEGIAYVTMWRALARGTVVVVSPLVNSHSIVAVVLAAVFLRDLERVTWRIGVATVLIVAGVMTVLRFGTL
ncbi:MAG TPA: EamA family transporter, partial [Gemmatimonadales bacterium]|nr:EamA family transporter [Gemmatimonadales bacterium]